MPLAPSLDALLTDTLEVSLPAFAAELVVSAAIVVLLLGRLLGTDRVVAPRWIALGGAIVACLVTLPALTSRQLNTTESLFTGLLINDALTAYLRTLLTGFLMLTTWLTAISGIPDREDGPDFYTLLFGATLGSMLMVQANHLLMLFLSIEMASVPGYVLVGFQKGRRTSGEAALKYLVYGAGAAGVLLYGTSLLAGSLGTASLPQLSVRSALVLGDLHPLATAMGRTVTIGTVFVLCGLAFKLAAVPFHFWCPDAFEGGSAEAAGFLSVAPKAAAFALLLRVADAVFVAPGAPLHELKTGFGLGIAAVAAATMTLGNLAAFSQENVKRLLAYSTIAHAGYLLMGVAAWLVAGNDAGQRGIEGLLYYLTVYLFMNLGVFAVTTLVRNATFGERLADWNGLGLQWPVLGATTVVCVASLVGLWPAGGFIGKFMIFAATWQAGSENWWLWALVVVAAINTVWSLFYYLRLLVALYFAAPLDASRLDDIKPNAAGNVFLLALGVPIVLLGIFIDPVSRATAMAAAAVLR